MTFYAVARGTKVGIYTTWKECELNAGTQRNRCFRKFEDRQSAQKFIDSFRSTQRYGPVKALEKCSRQLGRSGPKTGGEVRPPMATSSTAARASVTPGEIQDNAVSGSAAGPTGYNYYGSAAGPIGYNYFGSTQFTTDEYGCVIVYTHGEVDLVRKGARPKAGIGMNFGRDHALNEVIPLTSCRSTNKAQILAAEKAILKAKEHGVKKLHVKMGSDFLFNCFTKWIDNWKKNGWKTCNGEPVKSREDLEQLMEAKSNMKVTWTFIPICSNDHPGLVWATAMAFRGIKQLTPPRRYRRRR